MEGTRNNLNSLKYEENIGYENGFLRTAEKWFLADRRKISGGELRAINEIYSLKFF